MTRIRGIKLVKLFCRRKLLFRNQVSHRTEHAFSFSASPEPGVNGDFEGHRGRNETYNAEEVKKFENMAASWWHPDGPMKELHSMNKLRVPLVRDGLLKRNPNQNDLLGSPKPLKGFKILDVGCGGGILTEPLGRLGADVLGIDPGKENISVAEMHLSTAPDIKDRVSYESTTIENFVRNHPEELFDGVVSSETIEHVDNPDAFLRICIQSLKPGGSIFLTTLNRTFESWAGAIVAWEYILRRLPIGTHSWNKFLTPQEVQGMLNSHGCRLKLLHGMCYNPVLNKWTWTRTTSINYCLHATKEG